MNQDLIIAVDVGTGSLKVGLIGPDLDVLHAADHAYPVSYPGPGCAEQDPLDWWAALRAALPFWFPRVNEIIRLIGSHNVLATPTAEQLADPYLRPLIDTYIRGAGNVSAETRARVFRLGWDFAGSALASRNEQYERFYLTSGARNQQGAQMRADRGRADRLVDRFLDEGI